MAHKLYNLSVPGSLMLMGEHAVLYGKKALVCAIDKRILFTLVERNDDLIKINSQLGYCSGTISKFPIESPFEFVGESIHFFIKKFKQGFTLNIEASFSDKIGFGSSAAITVGMNAILYWWLNNHQLNFESLFKLSKQVVEKVQKIGSGADLAASILGGIVLFKTNPLLGKKLSNIIPLSCLYCGYKEKTAVVIEKISAKRKANVEKFINLDSKIDNCVEQAVLAIETNNLEKLGMLMNQHQEYMIEMGVSNHDLEHLVSILREADKIYGAKISGSGLGDCVIGLGNFETEKNKGNVIEVNISGNGVLYL